MRVSRKWQRRITVVCILLAAGVAARDALTATATVAPQARVHRTLEQLAGRPFELDCTYAAVGGAEAVAYPDGQPVVYVKARWCGQARSFVRRPTVQASKALLILTHEALHIRSWAGARDELQVECLALDLVDDVAVMLGARAGMAAKVADQAREEHIAAGWPECTG